MRTLLIWLLIPLWLWALSAEEIIQKSEDLLRGESMWGIYEMRISSPRYERTLVMESWAEGTKRSFIRIIEPRRDEGTTFLKLDNELWQFVPRIERTIKIPPSMMLQQWMGSDLTNDDMVRESSLASDYTAEILDENATGWQIALTPRADAAVVWSRIEVAIAKAGFLPLAQHFYDEKGVLIRTITFEAVREVDGRTLPPRWRVTPRTPDKAGHETVLTIREATFNRPLPEEIFTLRALKSYSRP